MSIQTRMQSRLLRVFVLQLAIISLVTICGVLAAGQVAERLLVPQALQGEADFFWVRRGRDPAFPLPNTLNLRAWFDAGAAADRLPTALQSLQPGQHRVNLDGQNPIVHVSEVRGERLYLVFEDATVSALAFWFGIAPLTFVLLTMYSLAYLAYRMSKRAVSPMVRLAELIGRFDFSARDVAELDLDAPEDAETAVLTEALEHFVERSKASIERERNFTRYASHELRTPVAVIQGSVSQLELLGLEGASGRAIARIGRTTTSMKELIDSLLMLARAPRALDSDPIEVVPVIRQLIGALQQAHPDEPLDIIVHEQASLVVQASEAIVSIVIGNLLGNACTHAAGARIDVVIDDSAVAIVDQGPGLDGEQQSRVFEPFYRVDRDDGGPAVTGHGLGLALVKSMADRHGWTLEVDSTPGQGSTFRIVFAS